MRWSLDNLSLSSRLLLGTALYPSPHIMCEAVRAARAEIITVSLRRQSPQTQGGENFWEMIKSLNCHVLPNTAGARNAREAITTAQMAREIFKTRWIKLEVIGDDYNLQPDPFGLVEATTELVKQDFLVFPYCTDDLVVCEKLYHIGCRILMPGAAPIGSGRGLQNIYALKTLRQRLPDATLIIDAGIGAPSQAAQAMELGFDAVLLNSAVALADDPIAMARAFALAIEAGHAAYLAGLITPRDFAQPSTPVIGTPFWHIENT